MNVVSAPQKNNYFNLSLSHINICTHFTAAVRFPMKLYMLSHSAAAYLSGYPVKLPQKKSCGSAIEYLVVIKMTYRHIFHIFYL